MVAIRKTKIGERPAVGSRGPLRKTAALAVATGMRPVAQRAAATPPGDNKAPAMPACLDAAGRALWRSSIQHLRAVGKLNESYGAILLAYCLCVREVIILAEVMTRLALEVPEYNGLMIRSPRGALVINPVLAQRDKAHRTLVAVAAQLGFTPISCPRLGPIVVQSAEVNPFVALKNANVVLPPAAH